MANRQLTFCEALNEATLQAMEDDPRVFVYGIGVPDHKKIFGTTNGILERFGPKRCLDVPLAEDSLMGLGVGAALNGLKPIYIHIRVDFLLLAMNQLINMASALTYCSGGQLSVPLVIRAVVGRGWGQGCQHSKSMQSVFAHIPGIKVVMPTTPYDAKGLLLASIRDPNPVVFIEHRWLYWQTGEVPEERYEIPIGQAHKLLDGIDITVVATSWMAVEAAHAAQILGRRGIKLEIIDPRTLSPLDDSIIAASVNKTHRCLVVDNDWLNCGFSAEVAARVSQKCFDTLVQPVERIGFVESPCPTARHLENAFYPNAATIVRKIEQMLKIEPTDLSGEKFFSHENKFKGPF